MISPTATEHTFDVAIVGGALAGASAALLLKQERPDLRVLVVERSPAFTRRVGEATVEVSGYFLGRVLGLIQYLNQNHIVKQGFRFWFHNDRSNNLGDCSEVGAKYLTRIPAYLVDRASLDEEVLKRAGEAGVEIWRPAHVETIALLDGGLQTLTVRRASETRGTLSVQARWVIDASGFAAQLARRQNWYRANTDHPIAAAWARWRGVKDWDDPEFARRYAGWNRGFHGIRNTATNHLMGDGWWAWFIPLKGGDVSVGVVYDARRVEWPAQPAGLAAQIKAFLSRHPAGRDMLETAEPVEGDAHLRRNPAWVSSVFAGNGFALVGDAAGFLDPFYSPGLDWLSFTVSATVRLVLNALDGKPAAPLIQKHNENFTLAYRRWFEALYLDKYTYLGDCELLTMAFRLDLGLYYLGVLSQPCWRGPAALERPAFSDPASRPFAWLMRTYNRRLGKIADSRRRRGCLGRGNHNKRFHFDGYSLSPWGGLRIAWYLLGWLLLEITEGWRSWGKTKPDVRAATAIPSSVESPRPADAPAVPAHSGS